MAATCPSVGKSNYQAVWAVLEDVNGVLQKPTAADYIVPRGNATMNQTPTNSASEELSESLNVTDQFQDAVDAGEASIPMYLRLDPSGGHMQAHALILAAMGKVQERDAVTASLTSKVGAEDDTIPVKSISGGILPPSGVIEVDTEKVRYSGRTIEDGVVTALTNCERGYAGTTAATHEAAASLTLKSRVYMQDTCRNRLSIWMKNDHTVTFGSGGAVTMTEFSMSNSGGQNVDVTVQFQRMGYCGRSFVSGTPRGKNITVVDSKDRPAVKAYSVGGYIKNTTKNLDNSGKGYRITAVDPVAGTITVEGTITSFADGDQLDAWTPLSSPVGEPLESRRTSIYIDGQVGRIREGSLSMGTPAEFLQEIGDEYPGEAVDAKRELSITMNSFFRGDDAAKLGKGYDGYVLPVVVRFGKEAGKTLSIGMDRVKMSMPEIGVAGSSYTLDRTGAILGTKGEDALYIVQE